VAGRSPKLVLLVLGTVVSLLMGAGLFALTGDSVTSGGNSAESGTWKPPAHDLQMATNDDFGFSCANADYTKSLPTTFSAAPVDLAQPPGAGPYISKIMCIKNAGTAPARLTASVTSFVQTETGCSSGEVDAGDATCGSGVGEVGTVLDEGFSQFSEVGSDPDCTASGYFVSRFEAGYLDNVLHPSLPAGATCRFVYNLSPTFLSVTEAQRLQAQSDSVQWDLILTLQDVVV
jgi:hypothetical protein